MARNAVQRLQSVNRRVALLAGTGVFLILMTPAALGLGYFGLDFARFGMGALCVLRDAASASGSVWLSALTGNGLPLWADPSVQVLHPMAWLLAWLEPGLGAAVRQSLDLAAGAGGAALLLRTFGVPPRLAVAGGLAFGLGGPSADLMRHAQYASGVLLVPAWAALRASRHPGQRRRALLALWGWALLMLLSSEAQAFGVLCAVTLAESALGPRQAHGPARWTLAGRWLTALVAAVLCALPVWLPTLSELALGGRSAGFSTTESMAWSMLPPNALALLVNGASDALMGPYSEALPWPGAWNANPYVGAALVALAVAGATQRRARVPSVLAAGLLLAALGDQTPVFPALVRLFPLLALFRYPEKYVLPLSLMLVVLAWVALNAARRQKRLPVQPALVAMGAGLGVVGLAGWFTSAEWLPAISPEAPNTLALGFMRAMVVCAGVAGLLGRKTPRWVLVAATLLAADAVLSSVEHLNVGPSLADVRSPLTTLQSPPPGPAVRVCMSQQLERLTPLGNDADGPWMKALLERVTALPNINACQGLRVGTAYSTLGSRMQTALNRRVSAGSVGAARALGCTHAVLSVAPVDEPAREVDLGVLTQAAGEGGRPVRVVVVPDPVPEAFVVRDPTAGPEATALERLSGCHTAGCALAVVDDPARRMPMDWRPPAGSSAQTAAESQAGAAERTVRVEGTGAALVGIHTAFLMGWEATQSGRGLPVVRVSGAFPAAVVEDVARGPVTFRYRPPRLGSGVAACLLGLLLVVLAVRGTGVTARFPRRPAGAPR